MARLGCVCGTDMTNTEGPSPHRLSIYYKEEIESAIKGNPNIYLWDFYTNWDSLNNCRKTFQNRQEPVEYWFCTKCFRIFEVQAVANGRILRSYKRSSVDIEGITELERYKRIFVLWDKEMDLFLSKDREYLLTKYVNQERIKYYISIDTKTVYGYDDIKKEVFCKYVQE